MGRSAATNYSDPANYPGFWPSTSIEQGSWVAYTYSEDPINDITGNSDPSRGTSLSGNVDASSGSNPEGQYPSTYVYGDGYNLFFRYRVNGPPYSGSGGSQPFAPATWTTLIDMDGDGWWDFALQLHAKDSTDANPNDLEVYFNTSISTQLVDTSVNAVLLWQQDCAVVPGNGSDGESGTASSWDMDSDPYIWDFGRSRIVQITRVKANGNTMPAGDTNAEYYLDFQMPIAAVDARNYTDGYGNPGIELNTSSWFSYAFATANSATDPIQKDYVYEGCLDPDVASQLPFGDAVNAVGDIRQPPVLPTDVIVTPNLDVSSGGYCTASADMLVLDTHTVSDCTTYNVESTLVSVELFYALDVNGNGIKDATEPWIDMGVALQPISGPGPWGVDSFDLSALPKGYLLIKGIATDVQGNVTDSYDTDPSSPTYNPATYNPGPPETWTPIAGFYNNTTCGQPSYTVSGYVYYDANANGAKDSGEGGLGVDTYVKMFDNTTTLVQMAYADPVTGAYSFSQVVNGTYTLIEDDNNDQYDVTPSDPSGFLSSTPNTISVTVSGASVTDRDFGDFTGYSISGYIYNDVNRNGTKDSTEGGLGVPAYAKLFDSNTTIVAFANVTTGYYQFLGVQTGSYTLIEDSNSTLADTTPNDPSGWTSSTPNTLSVTLSDVSLANRNFGDYNGVSITGSVFNDRGDGTASTADANNGVFDATESGIQNVTVRLCLDASCATTLDTASTAGDGSYTLWVPAGTVPDGTTVYIVEDDPGGYLSTGNSFGGVAQNDTTDTSADRNMLTYTMSAGSMVAGYDFGDVGAVNITPDQSYMVSAGDGVQIPHTINLDTPGTVGVMLASTNAWDYAVFNDTDCDGTLDGSAITPSGGYYVLNSGAALPAGQACIVLFTTVPSNLPEGFTDKLTVMAHEDWLNSPDDSGTPDPDTGSTYDDAYALVDDAILVMGQGSGMLRLEKWVRNITLSESFAKANSAEPCQVLEYRIDYKNIGAETLYTIVVSDNVPDGTAVNRDVYTPSDDVSVVLNGSTLTGDVDEGTDTDGVTLTDGTLSVDLFKLFTGISELKSGEEGSVTYQVILECN